MNYKTALITGASSGIGAEFARQLAAAGCDLILVARSKDKLTELADDINRQHGRRVEVLTADLSLPSPGAALAARVRELGMEVDLLVNNAGFGTIGTFVKADAAREQQEVMLNSAAVVDLAHAFLPPMVEAEHGGLINVASSAAFQAIPYMAVYSATKAFVLAFSLSLWGEYRRKGVKVLAVCPGPVDTPFFEATGVKGLRKTVPKGSMVTAQQVVSESLDYLQKNKPVLVPGKLFKLSALGAKFVPRAWLTIALAAGLKR